MRRRIDAVQAVGDAAFLVDDVADACGRARAGRVGGAVGYADRAVGIAQKREIVTLRFGKLFVGGFIVEAEQAGLFEVKGFDGAELAHLLNVFCPTNLFPYARQAIDQSLLNGGFPPIMLAPLNFEMIYRQSKQQQKQEP